MFDDVLLVRSLETRQTRAGEPFTRLTLGDRRQTVPAVFWDTAEIEQGEAVRVTGRLADHPRYGRQLTVEAIRPAREDEIDWDALADGPARPVDELEHELDTLIASVEDGPLRDLLHRLLDRRYRTAPAAKYNHHAYRGGLLEHSVQIAQLVSAAAGVFDGVDRDVAVTGALLHDIGKLEAYDDANGCADLNDAGRLESEIPLGYYRVRRELEDADIDADRARALLHVILAHHGRLEHGSPVVPATREAALVHAIDELSGQLGAFDRLAKESPSGERWSRYDRNLGTGVLVG